ncbi:MAG: MFS transporter [Saccharospirillum sp.]|nr:MFS transporter [Saccharospirillum sp.]
MLRLIAADSRPTVLASLVLTLTLVSDAVLYLLLPLFFEDFGLTLLWVGVLLSANRFVRLLINPWLVPWFQHFGARTAMIQAVVLASLASLSFIWLLNPWALLAARLLWGSAYALMRLGCLHYATEQPERRMVNLGWYTSLQEVGPLLVLLLTPLIVDQVSVQAVLVLSFMLCLVAMLPALALPRAEAEEGASARARLPWPNAWHRLTFVLCLLFDGVWTVILAPLLVAAGWSTAMALTLTSVLLVGKRLFNMALGFVVVRLDTWQQTGAWLSLAFGLMWLACVLMALKSVLLASALAIIGHGLFMILVPRLLSDRAENRIERQQSLNSFTFWRDLSAAVGALLAGGLIAWQVAPAFYGAWGVGLLAMLIPLLMVERKINQSVNTFDPEA